MRLKHLTVWPGLLLISCALFTGETASSPGRQNAINCPTLPGADNMFAIPGKRFYIFGEMHGTAEIPKLFGDFVCAAAARWPVVVGLELEAEQQPIVDRYLRSDGSTQARQEILRSRHWTQVEDGRASEAMFALLERLRILRTSGSAISVVAFIPNVSDPNSQTPYERAMAEIWRRSVETNPSARFVALVGSVHALRAPVHGFEPAAMHMPQESTLTLGYAPTGGIARNCQQDGCGPHPLDEPIAHVSRGIARPARPDAETPTYDQWYSVGRRLTASSPVWSNPSGRRDVTRTRLQ
jgi:hypothetical protein